MHLKAILWDNDGVLVDTERLYFLASRQALATVGIDLTLEAFAEISLGRGESVFRLAEQAGVSAARIKESRELRNHLYADLLEKSPDLLMPGVRELLGRLRPRVGIMGIVSNSFPEHFHLIHQQVGILPFFDFQVLSGDAPRGKPHPDPYLAALARAGVTADEAVAIEDNERGLQAALAAGLRCLIVPYRPRANSQALHLQQDGTAPAAPWPKNHGGMFPGATAVCQTLAEIEAHLFLSGDAHGSSHH
jgi:HAD superfamily hydrolase (TIGR01509 family)